MDKGGLLYHHMQLHTNVVYPVAASVKDSIMSPQYFGMPNSSNVTSSVNPSPKSLAVMHDYYLWMPIASYSHQLYRMYHSMSFFSFDRSCLKFICTNSTGGHQPHADSSPGVTPALPSSHWAEASTLELSLGPGHLRKPEPELEAELQLQA